VREKRCYTENLATVDLSLTHCADAEFNCNDGSCILLDLRCDGRKGFLAQKDDIKNFH
jgi:hypothetical protein